MIQDRIQLLKKRIKRIFEHIRGERENYHTSLKPEDPIFGIVALEAFDDYLNENI